MDNSVWLFSVGYVTYPWEGNVTVNVDEQLINDLEENGVLVIRGGDMYKSDGEALANGVLPEQYYRLHPINEIGIPVGNGGVPKQLLDYPMGMSTLSENHISFSPSFTETITEPEVTPEIQVVKTFANMGIVKRESIFIRILKYIKSLFYEKN